MGDEYLGIDDKVDTQKVSNMNGSDRNVKSNTVEGQSPKDDFFRTHRMKIGIMILIVIFVGIVIALGVGITSGQQQAGMTCL